MLATCTADFVGQRDRAILTALFDTGCRASELMSLKVEDLDRATGSMIVRKGKGGRARTVFLGHKSLRAILRYLRLRGKHEPGDALWVTTQRTPLKVPGLRGIIVRRAHRAGIPVPGIHDFRRAFALNSPRNGMDLFSLQRLMGHSDLSILRRYAAQNEQDIRLAHERFGPADRLL
jgi:site-specific recombinase XerD